jgi:pimeloyl-ACP methyl ester carboxylesterase
MSRALQAALRGMTFRSSVGTLHARAAGPADGPVVLLLHGFPEFWYGWRKQIPALASAGYHVIALDQRGYNESAKPVRVRDYALPELCADVLAVADTLGRDRICVAGHDWGGIVAWEVAIRHPDRVRRMAILNAPHLAAARRYLMTSPKQMLKSWYTLLFQLPYVPERLFSANDYNQAVKSLQASSAPGTFSSEELDEYRRGWKHPGSVTGMINWYRALARHGRSADASPMQVRVPTRILWGRRDRFLESGLAQASLRYCDCGDLIEIEDATHWLHQERPERVNAGLLDWFSRA